MIRKARESGEKKLSNDIAYWMSSTLSGVCIYLKNKASGQAFNVKFSFNVTNLYIKGMRPDETEISLMLNSDGGTNVCFLKPV